MLSRPSGVYIAQNYNRGFHCSPVFFFNSNTCLLMVLASVEVHLHLSYFRLSYQDLQQQLARPEM